MGFKNVALSNSDASVFNSETSFLSGVDATGKIAATSFGAWNYAGATDPATYDPTYSWTTKWGSATPGTAGGTVAYYFDPGSNWTATEKAGLISGLALWSDEVNIHFVEATSAAAADFTFIRGTDGAETSFPNEVAAAIGSGIDGTPGSGANISIDTTEYGFANIGGSFAYAGGYAYETLVHEEGHILGLGHAGPYDGDVDASTQQFGAYDSRQWELMSYIEPEDTSAKYYADYTYKDTSWNGNDPTTPQIIDILAAQRLYGAATSGPLANGGVHFGFNSNVTGGAARYFDFTVNQTPVVTLWAGGLDNTLDLSGFSQDSTIDLNPDSFSSADGMVNNIGIADGVRIDHAIGGPGNDVFILNNDLVSTVTGGGGEDVFRASRQGWEQSTITDLSRGDRINFTDASTVAPIWSGNTLTYGSAGGQALFLPNNPVGHLITSTDGAGGTDLTLANQDPGLNDFYGDGKSDILWQSTAGTLVEWRMNDRSVTSSVQIGTDPNWVPLQTGRGDFNGDHASDILYRNTLTGQVVEWDMRGATQVSSSPIGGDLNWSVVGTGDFNGDGDTDILWRNSDGALAEWQMHDRTVVSSAIIGLDPGWTVVGTGDFNGDGRTDILQRNSATGQVVEWDMNGNHVTSAGFIGGDLDWSVVGTGDFNGDGKSDILWRNISGALVEWQMNDRSILASALLGTDPNWSVVGTGDFNDTGLSDILQRNSVTGQVVEWDMHGSSVASSGLIGGGPAWHVASV